MLRYLSVFLSLALVGCASMESNREAIKARYVGKPLSVAVAGMGLPTSKLEMKGATVYAWVDTDSWGNECEVRLSVTPDEVVTGETVRARLPEACERLIR